MSYYEGLPIYKGAMDSIVLLERVTQRFPKRHKYTLGSRLLDTATDCLLCIARAQPRAGRMPALDRLCGRLEELKLLTQVGKEVKAFVSFQQFTQVVEQVVGVAKQAAAWRAHERRAQQSKVASPGARLVVESFAWLVASRACSRSWSYSSPWSRVEVVFVVPSFSSRLLRPFVYDHDARPRRRSRRRFPDGS